MYLAIYTIALNRYQHPKTKSWVDISEEPFAQNLVRKNGCQNNYLL